MAGGGLLDSILGSMHKKPAAAAQPRPAAAAAAAAATTTTGPSADSSIAGSPTTSKYAINPALLPRGRALGTAAPSTAAAGARNASGQLTHSTHAASASAAAQQTAASSAAATAAAAASQASAAAALAQRKAAEAAAARAASDMAERFRLEKEALVKKEKEQRQAFRDKMHADMLKFIGDSAAMSLDLPPMDNLQRAIVHSVADELKLITHAFGEDGVDRHIKLFKAEAAPSAEDLERLKDPEAFQKRLEALAKVEEDSKIPRQRKKRQAEVLDADLIHQVEVRKRDLRSIEELQDVVRSQRSKRIRMDGENDDVESDEESAGEDAGSATF